MIQSHTSPFKSLKQHVEEVNTAVKNLLSNHSQYIELLIKDYIYHIATFHDIGKATPEFQIFINEPQKYKKHNISKAHSPVSLLVWVNYALSKELPKDIILIVGSVIWKHHGSFPLYKGASGILGSLDQYDFLSDFEIEKYPFSQVKKELDLNIDKINNPDEIFLEDILDDDYISSLSMEEAIELKLKGLLSFSVLIEADRTFLALSGCLLKQKLLTNESLDINPKIVDLYLAKKGTQNNHIDALRNDVRNKALSNSLEINNIETLSLPTGLGKTMIGAQWILTHIKNKKYRKAIIVLPFLSIIDQTVKEYKNLLKKHIQNENFILEAHSIAERKYISEEENISSEEVLKYNDGIDFLAETWNSNFIFTTFDQFIYSFLSSENSHLIRFHNLADALIIIDEIQALPIQLWHPFSHAIENISQKMNTKFLVMSATQPNFLNAYELVENANQIFSMQNRYSLVIRCKENKTLDLFINECIERINKENWNQKRVMIVLNTRSSAKKILDSLDKYYKAEIFFLSADVIPLERLESIEIIKENRPCLVIATQCIEAGVDIDMDFVIRDLAPLDSIIQCAGRCNRNGLKIQGHVEIVSLTNRNGKEFNSFIYDSLLIQNTLSILNEQEDMLIGEERIFNLLSKYYSNLKVCMNTGRKLLENWAYWKDDINVKKLLRGDNEKYNLIVVSQEKIGIGQISILDAIKDAINTENVWERQQKLHVINNRITKLTVSIWANKNILLEEISEQLGCFNILKDNFYIKGKGLNLESLSNEKASMFL